MHAVSSIVFSEKQKIEIQHVLILILFLKYVHRTVIRKNDFKILVVLSFYNIF